MNAAQEHGGTPPVLAYEQEGKGGKRFVLQVRIIVRMMDEELKKVPFPPGYSAP